MRRIGLYGGSFDPVHLAHLVLAEQCREQLSLDEVWFIPAANPPHKPQGTMADGQQRLAMLRLAIAGHPHFAVQTLELDRAGPSYTVETLRQLDTAHPNCEWWLLLGADSVNDFLRWRHPEEIARLAHLGCVNRGDTESTAAQQFANLDWIRWRAVEMPGLTLSASDLRQRVATGCSIRYLVPDGVATYIAEQGLYLPSGTTEPVRSKDQCSGLGGHQR